MLLLCLNWPDPHITYMGGSISRASPSSLNGLFHGKSQSKMDDDWGTPILGNLHFTRIEPGTTIGFVDRSVDRFIDRLILAGL